MIKKRHWVVKLNWQSRKPSIGSKWPWWFIYKLVKTERCSLMFLFVKLATLGKPNLETLKNSSQIPGRGDLNIGLINLSSGKPLKGHVLRNGQFQE